jgi:hypothetical protein
MDPTKNAQTPKTTRSRIINGYATTDTSFRRNPEKLPRSARSNTTPPPEKFPAELYTPEGPWWNPSTTAQQTGQLSASQSVIPGPIPTSDPGSLPTEEAENGSATLHNPRPKRIHQLIWEDVINDKLINDGLTQASQSATQLASQPASAGPSGPDDRRVNAHGGLTTVCTAAEAEISTFSGGYDPMDTDQLGMERPFEIPSTGTNEIDKGKGIEKHQSNQSSNTDPPSDQQRYDPRERLPPFLINTKLGDIVLPAIIRGYENDPMARTGVRKPFKWHREKYIVLDDPSITENLRLYIPEGRIIDDDDDSAPTLRTIIIRSSHLSVGHQGSDKSYMQCRKCFYWPNMKKDFDQ